MSRIGKNPIPVPEKTDVSVGSGRIAVKGPLGELSRPLDERIEISVADGEVRVAPKGSSPAVKALWGTYASHVRNMIEGVNKPYEKKLLIEGVGYRWEVSGSTLTLMIGFSHPVKIEIPKTLKVVAEKGTLSISGIDKEEVGEFAASIRALKKPEPYKGKGIRYENEVIRRKQGKKTV